jgi:hypothetical protein
MATAVAVRPLSDDRLAVIAPFGLTDLFHMILRRNAARVLLDEYRRRYTSKRIADRCRASRSWTRRDRNSFRIGERPLDARVTPMIRSRRCSAEPSRLVL